MKSWLLKNWPLLVILLGALLVRVAWPLTDSFAFHFDHGKDGLAVLDLVLNHNLKFVGPWTSIPGLYFGAGWYYFLAACYWLADWDPVGGVWGMIGLLLIQVWLMYQHFGWLEALTVACGQLWLTVSLSAWNPFPLTLVTLLMLVIWQRVSQRARGFLRWEEAVGLGLLMGAGFYFSSAYAAFYLILIPLSCWLLHIRWQWRWVLSWGAGFLAASLPQILFEWKNGFGEVRAIGAYLWGQTNLDVVAQPTMGQILHISWGEIRMAFLPVIETGNAVVNSYWLELWTVIFGGIVVWWLWQKYGRRRRAELPAPPLWAICVALIVVPLLGFMLLHFNVWYLLGMMPAVVILVGGVIKQMPRPVILLWVVALVLVPVSKNIYFWRVDKERVFAEDPTFYRPKQTALAAIRAAAGDRPYAVYVFSPDLYDFAYQYLILTDSWRENRPLPAEFAYAPERPVYVKEKPELIAKYQAAGLVRAGQPELIFYIIENGEQLVANYQQRQNGPVVAADYSPDLPEIYFGEWLGQQPQPMIDSWQEVTRISNQLVVYVTEVN